MDNPSAAEAYKQLEQSQQKSCEMVEDLELCLERVQTILSEPGRPDTQDFCRTLQHLGDADTGQGLS
jgi:hypothetical protein